MDRRTYDEKISAAFSGVIDVIVELRLTADEPEIDGTARAKKIAARYSDLLDGIASAKNACDDLARIILKE